MAEFAPLYVSVLLRIGDGRPTEVGSFPVPLRAVLERDDSFPDSPQLVVRVDIDLLNEGLRRALGEAAGLIPQAWDADPDVKAARDAALDRWEATL